jgi:hypothetical protein
VYFVLNLHGIPRSRGKRLVFSTPCLQAGLFVGRQDKLIVLKRLSLPDSFIEIENPAGFFRKARIPRKNPAAVLPRSNGILMEPSPYRDSLMLATNPDWRT